MTSFARPARGGAQMRVFSACRSPGWAFEPHVMCCSTVLSSYSMLSIPVRLSIGVCSRGATLGIKYQGTLSFSADPLRSGVIGDNSERSTDTGVHQRLLHLCWMFRHEVGVLSVRSGGLRHKLPVRWLTVIRRSCEILSFGELADDLRRRSTSPGVISP